MNAPLFVCEHLQDNKASTTWPVAYGSQWNAEEKGRPVGGGVTARCKLCKGEITDRTKGEAIRRQYTVLLRVLQHGLLRNHQRLNKQGYNLQE